MATLSEIVKLLDAGYGREEIQNMLDAERQPVQDTPAAPEPEQAGLDPMQAMAELLGKINNKITEMQAFSILNSQQPEQPKQEEYTAEKALSELMRPPKHE